MRGPALQPVFDDRALDGDLTVEFGGVTLTVDRMSAPYVQGATIDFVDTIEKQGFTIDNPNATGSCACGDSFNRSVGGSVLAVPIQSFTAFSTGLIQSFTGSVLA